MQNAFEVTKNGTAISKITKDGQIADVTGKKLSLTSQLAYEFTCGSTEQTIDIAAGIYLVFVSNPSSSYAATITVYALHNYNGAITSQLLAGTDYLTITNVGTNSQVKFSSSAPYSSLVKIIKML